MKIYILQRNSNIFLYKVLGLLHFESCENWMATVQMLSRELLNERVLSTGEPCIGEYVTLLQSFDRGTLSIHWYISQTF